MIGWNPLTGKNDYIPITEPYSGLTAEALVSSCLSVLDEQFACLWQERMPDNWNEIVAYKIDKSRLKVYEGATFIDKVKNLEVNYINDLFKSNESEIPKEKVTSLLPLPDTKVEVPLPDVKVEPIPSKKETVEQTVAPRRYPRNYRIHSVPAAQTTPAAVKENVRKARAKWSPKTPKNKGRVQKEQNNKGKSTSNQN